VRIRRSQPKPVEPIVVDLHAHYLMHLTPHAHGKLLLLLATAAGRRRLVAIVRAMLIRLASHVANYPTMRSKPRVTVRSMRAGGVRVVLSVAFSFFDEAEDFHGAPPRARYLRTIEDQLDLVEERVRERHANDVEVAHRPADLGPIAERGHLALVHCVEGGFHLAPDAARVDDAVARLAARGVAYITLAHLIFRGVATDAPALPMMSDDAYRRWFPQPKIGLTSLGREAVTAMVRHGILIDVTHMSERSLADTFERLDEIDPQSSVPVIATHAGLRFADQEYMLSPDSIRRICARDGVIGTIFATHQLYDGLPHLRQRRLSTPSRRRRDGIEVLCEHIDAIHDLAGSHRHVAIGSDLDGFIKPTLPGFATMADMRHLWPALRDRYGERDADLICRDNALRMLHAWRGAPRGTPRPLPADAPPRDRSGRASSS
jgi:microsomal dipeptidase-like Zn-dependent dipeptidase